MSSFTLNIKSMFLSENDELISSNNCSFLIFSCSVQDIFKDSLRSPDLRLRVVKHRTSMANFTKKPPPPVFPRSSADKENIAMVETEERCKSYSYFSVLQ